jgi:hypothetical protein
MSETPVEGRFKKVGSPAKPKASAEKIDYDKLATMVADKLGPVFLMKSGQKEIHTGGMLLGAPSDILLNDGDLAIGGNTIEPVDRPLNTDYMKELAFMNEEIDIIIAETTDENAENPVSVGVNGVFKLFFRGHLTRARRYFVDCLIAKSSRVTTPKVKNGAGEDTFAIRQHQSHKYPFTVVRDPSPRGAQWLRTRMAELI